MNPWRLAAMALFLTACGGKDNTEDSGAAVNASTFTEIYANTIEPSCSFSSCHGGGGDAGGLAYTDQASAYDALVGAMADSNLVLVEAGNADGSYLMDKLEDSPAMMSGTEMPPGNSLMNTDPVAAAGIRAWIDSGAPND